MVRPFWTAVACVAMAATVSAQDYYGDVSSDSYLGAGSVGSQEPLFPYDDQEPWKHGYMQYVPFYGGYHSGRPYNYHHVFSQTQTSVGWGMPHGLPYSQQWWHRFEAQADPGRVQTEPNGYYGYAPTAAPNYQWAQMQPTPMTPVFAATASPIAPVQYQTPVMAPGVDAQAAPVQTQQLRRYLAAPGAY
ncbi:MAG: hypothetical protein ACK5Q5_08285 [Planctomycetaceae bacterium]